MNVFIKTENQRRLLAKIDQLKPIFQEREPELDQLGSLPVQNIEDLKKINYHTLTLPAAYGGQGEGLYTYILAQETISQACGSTGLSIGWHNGIILEYAENRHWRQETAAWLLKEVSRGALINTLATEPNTGSPTRGALPQTRVSTLGGDLIINGVKSYATLAPLLDYFLVTATSEQNEVETILVPRQTQGVTIKETWDMLAMRGTASHIVLFNDVRVPKEYHLMTGKAPFKASGWSLHIPACYLGIAAAARNYALQFATSYTPHSLGKPIAEASHIREKIGEMELALATARHLLYGTVERYEHAERKSDLAEAIHVTKIEVIQKAVFIVDQAMKIVGSRALSASNPMHRYYFNVRAGYYNPPMEDLIKDQMANQAIQLYSKE